MGLPKLIRDRVVPEDLLDQEDLYHVAGDKEFTSRLKDKLREEVDEFLESDSVEELADIMEVIYALSKKKDVSPEQLERIRLDKKEKSGSFEKRMILKRRFSLE